MNNRNLAPKLLLQSSTMCSIVMDEIGNYFGEDFLLPKELS